MVDQMDIIPEVVFLYAEGFFAQKENMVAISPSTTTFNIYFQNKRTFLQLLCKIKIKKKPILK